MGPGKFRPKNTGPWLVLARVSETNYRLQLAEGSPATVVHIDKLARYTPDFGVQLTPWITPPDTKPRSVETQTETALPASGRSLDLGPAVRPLPPVTDCHAVPGSAGTGAAEALLPRSTVYPLRDDCATTTDPVACGQEVPTPAPSTGLETTPVKRRAGRPAKAKRSLSATPAVTVNDTITKETQAATPAAGHTMQTQQDPTTSPAKRPGRPRRSKSVSSRPAVPPPTAPLWVGARPRLRREIRKPARYGT